MPKIAFYKSQLLIRITNPEQRLLTTFGLSNFLSADYDIFSTDYGLSTITCLSVDPDYKSGDRGTGLQIPNSDVDDSFIPKSRAPIHNSEFIIHHSFRLSDFPTTGLRTIDS